MRIGRDMMVAAQSGLIEYFALASGDADFIPAIEQVQDSDPRVIVLAFPGSISGQRAPQMTVVQGSLHVMIDGQKSFMMDHTMAWMELAGSEE